MEAKQAPRRCYKGKFQAILCRYRKIPIHNIG
jgi:hypothetical protein